MGLDAVIKFAVVPEADGVLEDLQYEFSRVFPPSTDKITLEIYGRGLPYLSDEGEIIHSHRYFGPNYARGPWPALKSYIEWMLQWGLPVIYDDDCGDQLHVTDLAEVAEITSYWVNNGYHDYNKYFTSVPKKGVIDVL